jgi:hypothetical protein
MPTRPVTVLATPLALPRLTAWLRAAGYQVQHDTQNAAEPTYQPETPAEHTSPRGGHLLGEARDHQTAPRSGHLLGEARSALWESDGGTLVTYLPTLEATLAAVTDAVLAQLPAPALWLQLAPMTLEDAHFLARRARAAGVTFFHAPYLQDPARYAIPADPAVQDRPACLVYGPVPVTGRGRADALVRALSWHAEWTGPLETSEATHQPELFALGDYATRQHTGRPTP